MIINLIIWILFGAFVGWIASLIMKTNEEQGAIMNVVVGIVGALIGGFLMGIFGGSGVDGFTIYGFLVALLGAIVLLALFKMIRRA